MCQPPVPPCAQGSLVTSGHSVSSFLLSVWHPSALEDAVPGPFLTWDPARALLLLGHVHVVSLDILTWHSVQLHLLMLRTQPLLSSSAKVLEHSWGLLQMNPFHFSLWLLNFIYLSPTEQ